MDQLKIIESAPHLWVYSPYRSSYLNYFLFSISSFGSML